MTSRRAFLKAAVTVAVAGPSLAGIAAPAAGPRPLPPAAAGAAPMLEVLGTDDLVIARVPLCRQGADALRRWMWTGSAQAEHAGMVREARLLATGGEWVAKLGPEDFDNPCITPGAIITFSLRAGGEGGTLADATATVIDDRMSRPPA